MNEVYGLVPNFERDKVQQRIILECNTISALEGLLEYDRFRPERAGAARLAQARGREFRWRTGCFGRTGRAGW